MGTTERIQVSVAYALADRQFVTTVELEAGASVADALEASAVYERIPDLPRPVKCAIYSRIAALTESVRDGDRVEILRPLATDPKEGRRRVAAQSSGKLKQR